MTTLFVIEAPGKKKKLESILGSNYIVRASGGHIRDLPENDLGIDPQTYRLKYVAENARAKQSIAGLKEAAAKCDRVLIATDLDREGEAIGWHIADVLKLKKAERVTYGEITEKAVKAAIANPRPLDMNLVHAQEARRALDRLIGWQVSSPLSDKAQRKLSAGRVQSPAVLIVVRREREIRAFKPTAHFGASLRFGPADAWWKADWQTKPHLVDSAEYMLDQTLAAAAAAVKRVRVVDFADTQAKSAPAAPFTTSTLQQRAQVALKFKPKKTMELAQRLYEQGVITYMRTDSPNLADEFCDELAVYAKANGLPLAEKRRKWKAKANAQEAHEAVRPTHVEVIDAGESDDEKALYRLIWSRTVASQLAEATFAVRTVTLRSIEPVAGDTHAVYIGRGRTLVDKGWKALHDEPEDDDGKDDAEDASRPLPELAIGAELEVAGGEVVSKTTKAPSRYTLATLVKELETNGIGRPSTYAGILDKITEREYIVEDKKGFLSPTPAGEAIVDNLVGTFGFIELDYTRSLEDELDAIASGTKSYREIVAAADTRLTGELTQLGPGTAFPCPSCGKPLRRREGRYGPFWSCSGYRDGCEVTLPDADGKPGEKAPRPTAAASPASPHVCPSCKSGLRRVTKSKEDDPKGKGYDFWSCTNRTKCNSTFKPAADGSPIFP